MHRGVQDGLLCDFHVTHRLSQKDPEAVGAGQQVHQQQETRHSRAERHRRSVAQQSEGQRHKRTHKVCIGPLIDPIEPDGMCHHRVTTEDECSFH